MIYAAGGVICAGLLLICCGGLWLSTKALAMRDEDECQLAREGIDADLSLDELMVENDDKDAEAECESIFVEGPASELDSEPPKIESETEVTTDIIFSLRTSRYPYLRRFTAVFSKSPAQRAQENAMYSTWKNVALRQVSAPFN